MSRAEKEEGQYMIRTIERAKTHYDVFQLPDDADAKTIRTTMRDMLRTIHPDKCGSAGLEATKRVNEAYDVLKDPDARAAYDLELREQREQREAPKPKAKPRAKKPAAQKPKARAASPKRAAPEDDEPLAHGVFGTHAGRIVLVALGTNEEICVVQVRLLDSEKFLISFDNYFSTHSEENREFSELIYNRLNERGLIFKKNIKQLFDIDKQLFLADRFVVGDCPKCKSPGQYGDNCETDFV